MTTLALDTWLHRLGSDYLDLFIADGGAAVKFAVPLDDGTRAELLDGLPQLAERSGYVVCNVTAAQTRMHMVDQLWFRIAAQLPFDRLAEQVVVQLAKKEGWVTPDHPDTRPLKERISEANELDPDLVKMVLERQIQESVFKRRDLAKDFRIAMTWLCRAQLNGGDDGPETTRIITDWLRGHNKQIAPVKPYMIFTGINRANARHLLESAFLWVRLAGWRGTVIVLDVERLTETLRPADGSIGYSKSALLDAYELLRQFIDSIDDLQGVLLCVVPAPEFLELDDRGRGIMAYQALFLRVYDEIRDRDLANPMASLVRLEVA